MVMKMKALACLLLALAVSSALSDENRVTRPTAQTVVGDVLEPGHYGLEDDNQGQDMPVLEVGTADSSRLTIADTGSPQGLVVAGPEGVVVGTEGPWDRRRGGHHGRGRHHGGGHRGGGRHHRGGHHRGRHHHHHGEQLELPDDAPRRGFGFIEPYFRQRDNQTEAERMTQLCSRLQSDRQERRAGPLSWKLRRLDNETREQIEAVWDRRRTDMLPCCQMESVEERTQCARNAQVSRYDRVCSGDEPVCPWALMATRSRADTTGSTPTPISSGCCRNQGWSRAQCFMDEQMRFRHQRHEMRGGWRGWRERTRRPEVAIETEPAQ